MRQHGPQVKFMKPQLIAPLILLLFFQSISAQVNPSLPEVDRVRLAEAFRLGDRIGDRVWPGWSKLVLVRAGCCVEWQVAAGRKASVPETRRGTDVRGDGFISRGLRRGVRLHEARQDHRRADGG